MKLKDMIKKSSEQTGCKWCSNCQRYGTRNSICLVPPGIMKPTRAGIGCCSDFHRAYNSQTLFKLEFKEGVFVWVYGSLLNQIKISPGDNITYEQFLKMIEYQSALTDVHIKIGIRPCK